MSLHIRRINVLANATRSNATRPCICKSLAKRQLCFHFYRHDQVQRKEFSPDGLPDEKLSDRVGMSTFMNAHDRKTVCSWRSITIHTDIRLKLFFGLGKKKV